MPKVIDTAVVGLKDVIDVLNSLPKKVGFAAVRKGLKAGGQVIADDAKARVPMRTGALRKSIVVETYRTRNRKEIAMKVTIARKAFRMKEGQLALQKRKKGERAYRKGDIYPRNYAHLVEWGTKPHSLGKSSKRKYAIVGMQHGAMHPGAAPKPFLRPAFTTKREAAVQKFAEVVRSEIDGLGKKGKK